MRQLDALACAEQLCIDDVETITSVIGANEPDNSPLSNFEAKYMRAGLPVYRMIIEHA